MKRLVNGIDDLIISVYLPEKHFQYETGKFLKQKE